MVSLSLIFLLGTFSIQHGLTAPVLENEDMQSLSLDEIQGDIVAVPNLESALKFSDETLSRDSIEQGIRVDSITDIQRIPEIEQDNKATSRESISTPVVKKDNPAPPKDPSPKISESTIKPIMDELGSAPTLRTEIEDREFLAPVSPVEQSLESDSPSIPEDSQQIDIFIQGDVSSQAVASPSILPIIDTEVKPRKTVKKDLSSDLITNNRLAVQGLSLEADSFSIDETKDIIPLLEEETKTTGVPTADIAARVETIIQRVRDLKEILGDLRQIRDVQNVIGQKLATVKSKFETLREAVQAEQDRKSIYIASEKLLENSNFAGLYDLNTPGDEEGKVLTELVQPGALHIEEVLSPSLKALEGIPNIQEPKGIPLSLQMSILPSGNPSTDKAYNFTQKLERPAEKPFYVLLGPFAVSNGTSSVSKGTGGSQQPEELNAEVVYIDPEEGVKPIPVMAIHGALTHWNHLEHLQ